MSDTKEPKEVVNENVGNNYTITNSEPLIDEAVVALADDEEIRRVLGLIIAEAFVLEASAQENYRPKFILQHIPYTADVLQELTQFKVQMHLSVIDRANALIAVRENPKYVEYLSVMDQMWTEFEAKNESDSDLNAKYDRMLQMKDELDFHLKKFRNLLGQMSAIERGIDIICNDCQKQFNEFSDIFCADELRLALRSAVDHYSQTSDMLSQRVESIGRRLDSDLNKDN